MTRRLLSILSAVGLLMLAAQPASAVEPIVTADNFEVMLVVDTSGSMRDQAISLTKQASVEFLSQMPPDVRIGLESFGRQITVQSQPTTDRGLLTEKINALTANGGTPLYDAVVKASQSFTAAGVYKAIVVLSDGRDRNSIYGVDAAVSSVQGVHVEAISLTTGDTDVAALQSLGPVTSADDPAGLSAAFTRVAGLLTKIVQEATTVPAATTIATTIAPTTVAPATTVVTEVATTIAPVFTPAPAPAAAAGESGFPWVLWIGGSLLFVALFALVLLSFPRRKVSKKRLGIDHHHSLSDLTQRASGAFEDLLDKHGKRSGLAIALDAAGISSQPGEFVTLVCVLAGVLGAIGLFLGGPFVGVALAGLVAVGARTLVVFKANKRRAAFADQLPDVLQLLTSSLRTGYGLTQALDSVVEEAEEPSRGEFQRALTETRLGRDITEATSSLAKRMQNRDMEWVVAAIDIHQETGGNLAEILAKVAETIRERQRMVRQVAALTGEGRISAYILTALPIGIAALMKLMNPSYFNELTHGPGLVLAVGAVGLLAVGWIWFKRIINIKF